MPTRARIQLGFSFRNVKTNAKYAFARAFLNSCGYFQSRHSFETETQPASSFIQFKTYMCVDYIFEEKQSILVELHQCSKGSQKDSTLVGRAEISVGRTIHGGGEEEVPVRVCQSSDDTKTQEEAYNGTVIICTREEPSTKENIILKMQGVGLDKKDMFGKSDPYILILRRNGRGRWEQCYKSEVVKKTLAPDWKPILISLDRLCGGKLDSEICFRCFDWDGAKGEGDTIDPDIDDVIGEFMTTTRYLLSCTDEGKNFELINRSKFRRKKIYSNSGIVNVKVCISTNACSFLDYILSGTSINVIVGIDMSNQVPQTHNPMQFTEAISIAKSAAVKSEYTIAIQAVVEILQVYDSDELFPAFGFGTRIGSNGRKPHLFPLTGDQSNLDCKGAEGVLEAYSRVINEVCGATSPNFSPLIKHVNEMARESHDSTKYFVLLILTTGFVDDWIETQKAVIEASFLPISIIFIGVGGGKFEDLQVLDQDFALLKVGQEEACRDNVQFVQMRRFLRLAADGSEEIRWNKMGLAKEVLAELPDQIMSYFVKQRLPPPNKIPYRPERTEQLADPTWWHSYMQPMQYKQSATSPVAGTSGSQAKNQSKQSFQDFEDEAKDSNFTKLSEVSAYSRRALPSIHLLSEKQTSRDRFDGSSPSVWPIPRRLQEMSYSATSNRRLNVGLQEKQTINCLGEESMHCGSPQDDTSVLHQRQQTLGPVTVSYNPRSSKIPSHSSQKESEPLPKGHP